MCSLGSFWWCRHWCLFIHPCSLQTNLLFILIDLYTSIANTVLQQKSHSSFSVLPGLKLLWHIFKLKWFWIIPHNRFILKHDFCFQMFSVIIIKVLKTTQIHCRHCQTCQSVILCIFGYRRSATLMMATYNSQSFGPVRSWEKYLNNLWTDITFCKDTWGLQTLERLQLHLLSQTVQNLNFFMDNHKSSKLSWQYVGYMIAYILL